MKVVAEGKYKLKREFLEDERDDVCVCVCSLKGRSQQRLKSR